jgi:methionyl-tRNA formyltransferase
MKSLRIILITQGMSRIVLPIVKSNHTVVGILESASRNYKKTGLKNKFFIIIKKIKDRFSTKNITLDSFAKNSKIEYKFMQSSEDDGLVEWIHKLKPDIIVIFSMSQLLKNNIYSIPRLGAINLHPSFLPDYRGPNPDFWQYYDMEMNPGVTVHYVDKGEDTGDIILQDRVSIPLGTISPPLLDLLIGKVGVGLVLKALGQLSENTISIKKQDVGSRTVRARNIKPEEHSTIIKWNEWQIERVWHVMRGTQLWLNCVSQPIGLYKGQRWLVSDFTKKDTTQINVSIGSIFIKNNIRYVKCRDGIIEINIRFSFKKFIIFFLKKLLY